MALEIDRQASTVRQDLVDRGPIDDRQAVEDGFTRLLRNKFPDIPSHQSSPSCLGQSARRNSHLTARI
ncbi:hypothetical protein GPA27_29075 [Aromatoleum toluolicum]|uniref:hypothetical protein n=1 Tax=Aromatoleum toluolicum TaxID=90060 RepID=UPI002109CB39|nr:hypothetical protein [Aromatoleum toluolicum]MCQ6964040.1 hypothetical protein [Aromatoleum toluolicum]